jgi:hypothetical protein
MDMSRSKFAASSRRKGNRFELAITRLLQDAGLGAEKISRTGYSGGDISIPCLGRDLTVEAKSRGSGFKQIYAWLEGRDALVVRADRCNALAILPLKLAVEILAAAETRK